MLAYQYHIQTNAHTQCQLIHSSFVFVWFDFFLRKFSLYISSHSKWVKRIKRNSLNSCYLGLDSLIQFREFLYFLLCFYVCERSICTSFRLFIQFWASNRKHDVASNNVNSIVVRIQKLFLTDKKYSYTDIHNVFVFVFIYCPFTHIIYYLEKNFSFPFSDFPKTKTKTQWTIILNGKRMCTNRMKVGKFNEGKKGKNIILKKGSMFNIMLFKKIFFYTAIHIDINWMRR